MLEGKLVSFLDEREIFALAVGADLAQEIAKAGDRQNIGRDLLAQSRHVRLYDYVELRQLCAQSSTTGSVLQPSGAGQHPEML